MWGSARQFASTMLVLLLLLVGAGAKAQRGGDLQAQILYAFQSEDLNALNNLAQTLTTQVAAGSADDALRYHLAHADYRLGLLAREHAEREFSDCALQLKVLLTENPDSVEALALQSACYSQLARLKKLGAVVLRSRAADRMAAALRLGPQNPRVVFLSAVEELAQAKPGSAELAHADGQLEVAAQLFERTSATGLEVPGWGHAEAYLALGRQLQSHGDVLGARNWIEKSLIMAPDYKAARRQLSSLVAR